MCGIIGILGKTDVQDRIVGGLSRLKQIVVSAGSAPICSMSLKRPFNWS